MQHDPDPDPQDAGDADQGSRTAIRAAGRPVRGTRRPPAQELDLALRNHRQEPRNIDHHHTLMVLLYQCVAVQARELLARQFGTLAHREDELVLRTLARIEAREEADDNGQGTDGKRASHARLLADYEFRPDGRAIYGYVLQKTSNIARNMQAEAYVPDGGFWSKDLKARFKALRLEAKPGHHPMRSGTQIDVPITASDDDEDSETHAGPMPAGLRLSETPMRHSIVRVNSLAQKLDALAKDMVGKTLSPVDGNGTAHAGMRLTVNHQRIWRAWLGLSHPDLIDLSEEELAGALGISKATVTRDTSAAFAYMLQRPDLRSLLALMEPNRYQSGAAVAKQLDLKLDELEGVLRAPNGKSFFRKCVHQWLGEHV